jgi:acid phosphatase family membrane protein YuiD
MEAVLNMQGITYIFVPFILLVFWVYAIATQKYKTLLVFSILLVIVNILPIITVFFILFTGGMPDMHQLWYSSLYATICLGAGVAGVIYYLRVR